MDGPTIGEDVDFEEFATTRLPALLRLAVVLTGSRTAAEDVVQEVLVRAQAKWRRIGKVDNPDAYVRRMVTNEYLSSRRRWWRWIPKAEVDPGRSEPDPALAHAERDELLAELGKLPPRQRAVLALRYYLGLSDTEIAAELGCTAGTVRGYAARALATLRVELRAPALVEEEQP